MLNFLRLDLGNRKAGNCGHTYIGIYNGFASTEVEPFAVVCGHLEDLKDKEITSNSFRITIRFVSGINIKSKGFRLAWTAITTPQTLKHGKLIEEGHCDGFYCSGGGYCMDPGSLSCNPQPRYCIAKSLRCDGVPNCGAYDFSDEDMCIEKLLIIGLSAAAPILLIIIVICVIVRVRRKQKQRAVAAKQSQTEKLRLHMQHRQGPIQEKSPDVYLKKLEASPATLRKYPTCNRKPCIGCEDMERCEGYVLTSSGRLIANHNDYQDNFTTYRGDVGNHPGCLANHHGSLRSNHSSLDSNKPSPPPPPPRDNRTHMDHILARKLVGSPV